MICRSCVARMLVLPVPNNPCRRIGHRHDLEGGECVVQRHRDLGLAVGVELHGGVPTAAACRAARAFAHGRRRRPQAPPSCRSGAKPMISICAVEVSTPQLRRCSMASSRFQLALGISSQQGLVHGGHGHFGVGGRLAAGQRGGDGDRALPRTG